MAGEQPISTGEAARRLGVNRTTVARWIRLGELPAMKTPGRRGQYRIDPAVIERLRRQMQGEV